MANTSTPAQNISESADQTVVWQSACWTLISLGLNAMTQPSAADRFIPAAALSPARSSPFICLADILIIFMWTIFGCVIGAPLKATPTLARHHLKVEQEDPYEGLQKGMPSIGITFFVLGPLPQVIQLWGMRGVPLTQTIGSVYMTVYLLTILTSLFPEPKKNYQSNAIRKVKYVNVETFLSLSRWIYFTAFALQVLSWVAVLFLVAGYFVNERVAELFTFIILMITIPIFLCRSKNHMLRYLGKGLLVVPAYHLLLGVILLVTTAVTDDPIPQTFMQVLEVLGYIDLGYLYTSQWILVLPCVFLVVMILSAVIILLDLLIKLMACTFGEPGFNKRRDAETALEAVPLASPTATQQTPNLSSTEPSSTAAGTAEDKDPIWLDYWPVSFAVTNLICALIYYKRVYNAEGTVLPTWTGVLG